MSRPFQIHKQRYPRKKPWWVRNGGRIMAQTLEIKGGDLITPRSLFDVMEVIEEYMGCEVRQYLEGFLDGTEQPENIEDESENERYRDTLMNLQDKVDDVDMEMQRTRIDRKTIQMHLSAMRRMIRREL